ncbi:MAG: DUF2066 domain-containing protein [Gammaproteobacteria bacterium]|nr:DUF2066 domain-containing protein [Gammaproteobacteria bacterium]
MLAPDPKPAYIDICRRLPMLLLCWLFCVGTPQAETLYSSRVPVVNQDEIARAGAVKAGLAEILVRLSGDSTITRHYAIGLILKEPEQYLASYEYKTLPESESGTDLQLQLNFDPNRIRAVMRDYQIPLWPESRPATLLWLALQQQGQRQLVGPDSDAFSLLEQAAKRRGLPLILPLLDLEDRVGVALSDVWLDDPSPIKLASQRYQPDALVIARAEQTASGWQARWTLHLGGETSRWESHAASLNRLLTEGIDGLTDRIARQYVSNPADHGSEYSLKLSGIKSFVDYARATKYIGQLEPVLSMQPDRLTGEAAVFRLKLQGNAASLARRVELDAVLLPVGNPATWPPSTLEFHLLPKIEPRVQP